MPKPYKYKKHFKYLHFEFRYLLQVYKKSYQLNTLTAFNKVA